MNLKILAVMTVLSLMTSAIIALILAQQIMAKNNDDKCITKKNKGETSSSTICVTGDDVNSIKDLKKICKVHTDSIKCSTSQTDSGNSINFTEYKNLSP